MNTATRRMEFTSERPVLHLAIELSKNTWKLAMTTGFGRKPRERSIPARDVEALRREIEHAKRRFGLPSAAPVLSCYEAGREGFWLHRFLLSEGIKNVVVDSSSIEVNRRARRAKSDRLDVKQLVRMLMRYHGGEDEVWKVVRVPTVEEEDRRNLHRELIALKRDRTRLTNRIKGLLASQGISIGISSRFSDALKNLRLWDGRPLAKALRSRIEREYARLRFYNEQIRSLESERRRLLRESAEPAVAQARQLCGLRGIGENGAWILVMEFFSWRGFRNRREVGGLAGLAGSPYRSGDMEREQGISKAGNEHVRAVAVELAWGWLRHQPNSELTRWYEARFASGSRRIRKIGIIGLARRLLIELWRYLETGALPEGAELKPVQTGYRTFAQL